MPRGRRDDKEVSRQTAKSLGAANGYKFMVFGWAKRESWKRVGKTSRYLALPSDGSW